MLLVTGHERLPAYGSYSRFAFLRSSIRPEIGHCRLTQLALCREMVNGNENAPPVFDRSKARSVLSFDAGAAVDQPPKGKAHSQSTLRV